MRLVDHRDRARATQGGGVGLPLGVAHQVAGGVLEVGDQVGQPRGHLAQRRGDGVEVPAVGVDGRAGHPRTAVPDRERRVGVAGGVDQHPVARPGEGLRHHRDRRQRAVGDQDLPGVGRQAALVEGRRDRRLELGHPGREVAMTAQVRRQLGRGRGVRLGDARRSGGRRAVEVDRVVVALPRAQGLVAGPGPPARHPGEGAGPVPGRGVAGVAQGGVGAGDGGAGDAERVGELALARQPDVVADPAVADQVGERGGQAGVRRAAVEVTDQGGHPTGTDGRHHAGHCLTIGYSGPGQSGAHSVDMAAVILPRPRRRRCPTRPRPSPPPGSATSGRSPSCAPAASPAAWSSSTSAWCSTAPAWRGWSAPTSAWRRGTSCTPA